MNIKQDTTYETDGGDLVRINTVTLIESARFPVGGFVIETGECHKWTREGISGHEPELNLVKEL